ncbi:MAG TPA: aminotransferase class I/II-fold pyridoxal phosphate-dependent enzyme, partial [Arachidicoccus sp.]|nr:aminotransferase class I/II-fold pyridoxal phosphate-dependent enzyme [Arachidicoccus sp.]
TGSRLLSGNSKKTQSLETFLAAFHKADAALLFNSGYDANLGLISAISNRHTTILYDAFCHASLLDGIRLSHAKQHYRFTHNQPDALEKLLVKYKDQPGPVIVVVESIYSMEGDQAPLQEIAHLCNQYAAALIVDEAHATGIYGPNGAGLVTEMGLELSVFARIYTFGKAMGVHGACVVGGSTLKQYLINFARSFIYSTALPPGTIRDIRHAYTCLVKEPERRAQLSANIKAFALLRDKSGLDWFPSESPIQSLQIGSNHQAREIVDLCEKQHINVAAILSPTVAKGTERLRLCLHSYNTAQEFQQLFEILDKWQNK